ncbi:Type 4 prepilin-like proteins leader peptide-processing enzyme [Candidatus Sulfotelmatomonas gaucii]|uniref:Type 4 prepilin-like proteins leader peptide-processing enzyme n=1 Tax=Candidatus Sulfuritelmatomonas gaucii TaxID=2043161 RepID=A0A2N9L825_9BACT|nr:Type 4 prepilin-like proteins leader peptide-processing enzyme [Candidatus Sulfotelmatomonas gaucii]
MIRILGTVFAGLLGLAFGSFLNVCVSRWPAGESVARPRSHCRSCGRTLAWWENLPLISWLALRGHCRSCKAKIGWRYPLVELAVGGLWASIGWRFFESNFVAGIPAEAFLRGLAAAFGHMFFYWLLVALAALDAEHLWLPDWLTWPGVAVGFVYSIIPIPFGSTFASAHIGNDVHIQAAIASLIGILVAAGLILLIRWIYKLIRHREGIGLGDAKLMALLAAWLGLPGALCAFALGVVLGALAAIAVLAVPSSRKKGEVWALTKLPLGTFLCLGGIISGLWGQQILAGYLRWAGF